MPAYLDEQTDIESICDNAMDIRHGKNKILQSSNYTGNHSNIAEDDRVYGYEKRGNTNFIVTSGIADWVIKFKTGCKSEYLLISIEGQL